MEEKKKFKITANKKVVTFSLIALALLVLVSTSYAYFTATIIGNDTAKQAKVTTGTMGLKLTGNTEVGMSSAMPGESTTITFSVENTGTLATTYALTMDQVTNNFVDKSDLVYTITSTNKGGSKSETVIPSTNGVLIPAVSIEPKVTQIYTMTIIFKETNDIQNDNQGKTFTGRVQINTLENSNYLAAKVVSSNPITDYETIEPQWINDQTVSIDTQKVGNGPGICVTDSFDNFNLASRDFINYTCDVTNPEDYIGWFTFGFNDYVTGYEIYHINDAKGATITNADVYNMEPKEYDGVIKTQDENGTSYINRGSITNNYVSFANKIWRIVRVNGDGTIRLILDSDTGTDIVFNTASDGHKYIGYTYDNDHACTKANPCTSETGTNSTIKDYLENEWYSANLSAYDEKIAVTSYCNDTTYRANGTERKYTPYINVLENQNPTLNCEGTTENYGGYYQLKIGLLTADELMLGGIPFYSTTLNTNYLYHDNYSWTMSPSEGSGSSSSLWFHNSDDLDYIANPDHTLAVYPVINLKADILVTSGSGTESSPYVIG